MQAAIKNRSSSKGVGEIISWWRARKQVGCSGLVVLCGSLPIVSSLLMMAPIVHEKKRLHRLS